VIDNSDSDLPDINLDSSFDGSEPTVNDSDFESVVEVTRAEDFIAMIPKKKKKKAVIKPKSSRAKGRPRGSGASAGLPRAPAKKPKKAVGIPVRYVKK
jgi:hypothetical protein